MTTAEGLAIEGAYKSLCAAMLIQAVHRICGTRDHDALHQNRSRLPSEETKELASQRTQAREWVNSDEGQITFAEACETIGMDAERVRRALQEYMRARESRVA